MPKCRRTPEHCRKIKPGGHARTPCTRDGALGTRVRAHYSPKRCNDSASAARIQAAVRGLLVRSPRNKSATRIQAAHRGRTARREVQVRKEARDLGL